MLLETPGSACLEELDVLSLAKTVNTQCFDGVGVMSRAYKKDILYLIVNQATLDLRQRVRGNFLLI